MARSWLAMFLLSVLAACDPPTESGDAGMPTDATAAVDTGSVVDAGDAEDAGGPSDAGIGRDAGMAADAASSPDASASDGGDPEWIRATGLPDECVVEHARHPEAVIALHNEPCTDGWAGCSMVVLDRMPAPTSFPPATWSGLNTSRGTYVWSFRDEVGGPQYRVVVHDDVVVAAWRATPWLSDGYCTLLPVATTSAVGVVVAYSGAHPSVCSAAWGGWDALAAGDSFWDAWHDCAGVNAGHVTSAASPTTLAVAPMLLDETATLHMGDDTIAGVAGLVDHDVVWARQSAFDGSGDEILHRFAPAGGASELVTFTDSSMVEAVQIDGHEVSYRVAHPPELTSARELWTGTYPDATSTFAPHLVRSGLPDGASMAGDGRYAVVAHRFTTADPATVFVYDLVDGSARRFDVPAYDPAHGGWALNAPLWITHDELALGATYLHPDGTGDVRVMRVAASAWVAAP